MYSRKFNKYSLVDETGLEKLKVDERAVDEIAVDKPGSNLMKYSTATGT